MTPIALDAMGGDRAPSEIVAGAVAAAAEGIEVVLVGDEPIIKLELESHGVDIAVVHAPESIDMGDDPARALREKPDSSISVAARLVHDGAAGAFVSAGSTGAAMAAAAIIIGRARGVLRPTIASLIPTPGSPTLILDCGANPEVKPEHLVQFALMGSVLAEMFLGAAHPRVGLLNIGEEPGKGRPLEKETYDLLSQAGRSSKVLNFVGNIEGRDLAQDRADVIITDGFVGNVVLKTIEGAAAMVFALTMSALKGLDSSAHKKAMELLEPLTRILDYEHHGGAHLLGVNGVVVIAHGASGRTAIANALRQARDGVEHDLVGKVTARLTQHS